MTRLSWLPGADLRSGLCAPAGLTSIFITRNFAHVYLVADEIVGLYYGQKVREFSKERADPNIVESLIIGGDGDLACRRESG